MQQSGGSAPGAEIDAYSMDASLYEAFLATYAQIVDTNYDDIVSTSYGGCELEYTAPYNGGVSDTYLLQAYHDVFLQGNAFGITFVFSSGDDAGKGCVAPGYFQSHSKPVTYPALVGVNFYASDPAVTAVGGTNLTTATSKTTLNSSYVSEQAIADYPRATQDPYGTGNAISGLYWGSGGGQSVVWPRPSYQTAAAVNKIPGTGRLVPDVSLHMGGCPGDALSSAPCVKSGADSSDIVGHDGLLYQVIGTSASAPEFAGLLAVLEQLDKGKRLGNVNPLLYANGNATYFHQGIPGTNGIPADTVAKGKLGYNVILGVGTPKVVPLLERLTGIKTLIPAGLPQTASNP